MSLKIKQTWSFQRIVKRLNRQQKVDLDKAVRDIAKAPESGNLKSGDLDFVRVHKFKMNKQLALLAYTYEEKLLTLTLLYLGSHENFYRDLKKKVERP